MERINSNGRTIEDSCGFPLSLLKTINSIGAQWYVGNQAGSDVLVRHTSGENAIIFAPIEAKAYSPWDWVHNQEFVPIRTWIEAHI